MKRSPERQWFAAGFGLTSLLVGLVCTLSYQNATHLIESTNKSKQTYEAIGELTDLFALMTVAESGRRGYIFLGDQRELYRYQDAVQKIVPALQALEHSIGEDHAQMQRFSTLESLFSRRIALLQKSVLLHQRDRSTRSMQVEITNQSVALRDEIQAIIAEMRLEEERLLQQWLQRSQLNINHRLLIEFLVTCSGVATLGVLFLLLYRQLLERQQIEVVQYKLEREQELAELKLRFFSMVSHEFRTPLSIILGSAQLLTESSQGWTAERRLKNLHRIQSSAKLMTRLLTDILTLTRAEANKLEYKPELLDLEAFCLNLVEEVQLSNRIDYPIKFVSCGACSHANLDEKLLYSMLSNLLLNAMKYSEPGKPIYLTLICQPEATTFEVKDEGRGISQSDRVHLYEPFYRGQNTADVLGTGLGLAVVKQCVDLHRGEISVESTAGVGTTFKITIPQHRKTSGLP